MTVPAAPVITAAVEGVGGSAGHITTTWGAVAGATSYKYFFGQDDPTTPVDFDDAAVSPLEVGFDLVHVVYIRVKAHNASGDSPFSNLVGLRPGQAPRAPTLAAELDGDTAATLTWGYVGNENVAAYKVYRGLAVNPTTLLASGQSAAPYEDTDLDPGTTYHYRVTATNAHGESVYSNDVTITTPAPAQTQALRLALRAGLIG
jgi:hypothetical protein